MARRKRETEEQRARRVLISELLSAANVQSMDDIQDLFKETIAEFMEGSLESELDEELGYEPYDVKNKYTDNSRNGHSKKTLRTSMGKVEINVPSDRNGEFEPQLIRKNQTSILRNTEKDHLNVRQRHVNIRY
jgi:transposase-like protein